MAQTMSLLIVRAYVGRRATKLHTDSVSPPRTELLRGRFDLRFARSAAAELGPRAGEKLGNPIVLRNPTLQNSV